MRSKTILILGVLLVVAIGVVGLTSGLYRAIANDMGQASLPSAATADAASPSSPPPLPASFYGTVTVDGVDVPEGQRVSAWIDGVQCAETLTFLYEGRSMYVLNVPGDGGQPGDTIVFHVGELVASPTATWRGGTNTELNLTAMSNWRVFLPLVRRIGTKGK
jgi:hypothetical protein